MSEHSWIQTRNNAIDQFAGETPGNQLEEDIITHYREHPVRVEQAITSVAERKAAGKVFSAWAVLRRQLQEEAHTDIVVDDQGEQRVAVKRASTWVRNAGLHYHQADLIDELYTHGGQLAAWPDTKPETLALWQSLQPTVAKAEAHQHAYDQHLEEQLPRWLERRRAKLNAAQTEVLARQALTNTEQLIHETNPTPPEPRLDLGGGLATAHQAAQ